MRPGVPREAGAAARPAERRTGGVFRQSRLGQAGSAHLAAAWDQWHLPGPTLGGLDPASWAWTGSLANLVVPGKCPPSLGLLQGRLGHWGPEGHVGRGLETEPKAELVHLPGTLGLLLNLLGSPTWPEGTVIQRISKKFWSG